jgi:hypothetical protein
MGRRLIEDLAHSCQQFAHAKRLALEPVEPSVHDALAIDVSPENDGKSKLE